MQRSGFNLIKNNVSLFIYLYIYIHTHTHIYIYIYIYIYEAPPPASYPMGTRGSFPGGKAAGA
jgi:hypothetical protein